MNTKSLLAFNSKILHSQYINKLQNIPDFNARNLLLCCTKKRSKI